MGTRVVASPKKKRTELEQFAMWFHQDWGIMFPSFEEAAAKYIAPLPSNRRGVLRKELSAFLDTHASATRQGMMRWWMKLGAQGRPTNLKDALRTFAGQI
jgi:hypothetical protein